MTNKIMDYKYESQLLADQMAEDEHGKDFYKLPPDVQHRLYERALTRWTEQQYARAESMEDR